MVLPQAPLTEKASRRRHEALQQNRIFFLIWKLLTHLRWLHRSGFDPTEAGDLRSLAEARLCAAMRFPQGRTDVLPRALGHVGDRCDPISSDSLISLAMTSAGKRVELPEESMTIEDDGSLPDAGECLAVLLE